MLVIGHTVAYGQRLQDVCPLVGPDLRVEVTFTVAPHRLGAGTGEYLARSGVRAVPWEEALKARYDLALAAGSQGIHEVGAPVVRISHGASSIKPAPDAEGPPHGPSSHGPAPSVGNGLSRASLTWDGEVVPAALVLAHEEERAMLSASCPEALPVAEVVGDPCHDRIVASLPHRAAYRRALGVGKGQTLLLITSTWGEGSSMERLDALLSRVVSELPADRFSVAATVHPNAWAYHGPWQVRSWLESWRRHGVRLIGPESDWRPALIAADAIIGDHGSVTLYGTLTGAAILLTHSAARRVNPSTPAADLALAAPALVPSRPLAKQVEYALATHRADDYVGLAARITSHPGRFNHRMRALLYRMLRLGQPAFEPEVEPIPVPGGGCRRPGGRAGPGGGLRGGGASGGRAGALGAGRPNVTKAPGGAHRPAPAPGGPARTRRRRRPARSMRRVRHDGRSTR